MKVVLAFLAVIISTVLVAQSNSSGNQSTQPTSAPVVTSSEKIKDKKVHYVEKRTRPVQNSSRGNSNSQNIKKPLVRKSENQKK